MDAQNTTPEKRKPARWERAFLSALAVSGNVTAACRAARVDRRDAYRLKEAAEDFAAAWQRALEEAADDLEAEAVRRARDGVEEPVIHKGRLTYLWVDADGRPVPAESEGGRMVPLTVRKYSDTLLIFLLKAHRPERFRDNVNVNHGGTLNIRRYVGVDVEDA